MITINGLNFDPLQGYLVEEVTYKHTPTRNLQSQNVSRRPGDKIIANEWSNKIIEIKGRVFGNTPSDLMTKVDSMQLAFSLQDLALTIDTGRTYTATLTDLQIPTQFYNLSMIQFDAQFTAFDPFAYTSALTASGTSVSGTVTYSGTLTISGTVFNEPTLTIIPYATTIKSLKYTHIPTSEVITISGTFTQNTQIVIDFDNFLVTNNGAASDYSGLFPRFEPGSIAYTLTTVSGNNSGFDYIWSYKPRYFQ